MNTLNIQLSFCNARIKQSPQYSLEVAVIFFKLQSALMVLL